MVEYLRSENLKQGYLVLFDPREKGFKDFKENQTFEDEMDGYEILSLVINI